MLLGGLKKRVRSSAGDVNVLQFDNETLIGWINDGIKECIVHNQLLQKTATSSTAVGVFEYDLPPDIFKLHSVFVGPRLLSLMTLNESEQDGSRTIGASSGQPVEAHIWAKKLSLAPTPSQIESLKINYTYEPSEIAVDANDNTELPLPSSYHNRLVSYCLAQVALQDENLGKYNMHQQEFVTGVLNLKYQQERQENEYGMITFSDNDLGDAW